MMKSRSLLVNYTGYPTTPNAFMPDNGLAVLANSLLSSGHETTILDYNTIDIMKLLPHEYGKRLVELAGKDTPDSSRELKEISAELDLIQDLDIDEKAREITDIIRRRKIDFLGFKLWMGQSFENGIKLAKNIKSRNPGIRIFAGGSHVDYFRGNIYKVTDVYDVLAYGEGEETIVDLAEYAIGRRELKSIPNLVIKDGSGVWETPEKRLQNLDKSFPIYDTDIYPALKGDQKLKLFISEFSRGCPFKCNFCGHSNKSGSKWRSKSPEHIISEFRHVIDTHGTRVFRNGDSNTPGMLIRDVAERIVNEGLDIEYALISHVNNLDMDALDILKKSGCFSVFFGVESGNQQMIDKYINKGLKLENAKRAIDECRKRGLFVVTSYVYPSPGETEETKRDTYNFIKESGADAVSICTPIITPKSTWGDKPGEYFIELSENYFYDLMFFTPALFYPPTMWKPLNYKINGKDFFEIAGESDRFADALEKEEGMLTQVMDDAALMSKHCRMDFREFRSKVRHYLKAGDRPSMEGIIKTINRSASSLPVKISA